MPDLPPLLLKVIKNKNNKKFYQNQWQWWLAGNFQNYALYKVTEKCPYPPSLSTAPNSAQHVQKAQNTVA